MKMQKEFIVAMELGSSHLSAIAGKKEADGSLRILALEREDSSSYIRRGAVFNIDKTVQSLSNIIQRLQTQLKTEITQVYVGVGGQSVRSEKNIITKDLAPDTIITDRMVVELMDANRELKYPGQEIIDVINQEHKVDTQYLTEAVGIQCSHLEGNFLNILQRKLFNQNLNRCFQDAGITIAELITAPIALADNILTDAEKRSGCALVDIGSSTTTVLVYSKNMLRRLVVIPLGSGNITKDIASLQIDEEEAEKLKIQYGCALTQDEETEEESYPVEGDRQIEASLLRNIVEDRTEELIKNVWKQIFLEYNDGLNGGIILTGGGSNLKGLAEAFRYHTHAEKIRIAGTISRNVISSLSDINAKDGSMTTLLSLLARGERNCAGGPFDPEDMFGQKPKKPAGPTPEELRQEQLRKQREQEEAERAAREEQERIERERQNNTPLQKIGRGIKKIFTKITEEEQE